MFVDRVNLDCESKWEVSYYNSIPEQDKIIRNLVVEVDIIKVAELSEVVLVTRSRPVESYIFFYLIHNLILLQLQYHIQMFILVNTATGFPNIVF